MKRQTILFLFIALMVSGLQAQTIKIKEPDFIGSVIFVNDTIGEGLPMTFQEGVVKVKSILFKNTGYYFISGCCSTFSINKSPKIFFIAKFADNSIDPAKLISVNQLKPDKDIRIIGEFSNNESKETRVTFNSKKYGSKSYLIEVPNLEKGEYAIAINKFYYSFSIK